MTAVCHESGVGDGVFRDATTPNSGGSRRDRLEHGQATVELALCLPFVLAALLLVVQVGLVVDTQVLVVHAAREIARAAAVGSEPPAPDGLDAARLDAEVDRSSAGRVRVTVRYRAATDVPLVGVLVPDVELAATATMRDEAPSSPGP